MSADVMVSEVFEIAEAILNELPPAIHGEITRNDVLAIRLRRNDGLGSLSAKQLTQTIVVEALGGQQRLPADTVDQVGCCNAVVALSGKQNEAGEVFRRIDEATIFVVDPPRERPMAYGKTPFAPMPC